MSQSPDLVCKTTKWFYLRWALLIPLMLLVFGGWFLRDAMVGYPKKGKHYQIYKSWGKYEKERKAFLDEGKDMKAWLANVANHEEYGKHQFADEELWRDYAEKHDLPDSDAPELKEDYSLKVKEQHTYATLCGTLGVLALLYGLWHLRKKMAATSTAFITSGGKEIPFDAVHRVDQRKWKRKGLAYVFYKDANGREGRATVDCLKYGPENTAEAILERIRESFSGELIDYVEPEEDLDDQEASEKNDADIVEPAKSDDDDDK